MKGKEVEYERLLGYINAKLEQLPINMKYGLEDGRHKYHRDRMVDAGIDLSNRSGYDKITKEVYNKVDSLVKDKISTHRQQLERKGKIKTTIFTFEHIYIVELHNDDDYSFEILDKEQNN